MSQSITLEDDPEVCGNVNRPQITSSSILGVLKAIAVASGKR